MRQRLNPPIRGSIVKTAEKMKRYRRSQSPYKGFNSGGQLSL